MLSLSVKRGWLGNRIKNVYVIRDPDGFHYGHWLHRPSAETHLKDNIEHAKYLHDKNINHDPTEAKIYETIINWLEQCIVIEIDPSKVQV